MGKRGYTVVISRRAVLHLRKITKDIEKDNPQRATTYRLELIAKAKALSDIPLQGTPYYAHPEFRSVSHGNYVIIYDIDEKEERIEILAFWHGARKPPKL